MSDLMDSICHYPLFLKRNALISSADRPPSVRLLRSFDGDPTKMWRSTRSSNSVEGKCVNLSPKPRESRPPHST